MSAADLLRTALDDAPDMHAERDADGTLTVWNEDGSPILYGLDLLNATAEDDVAVMRLLGLLLAAAPHLADLLDAVDPATRIDPAAYRAWVSINKAITEAGESL